MKKAMLVLAGAVLLGSLGMATVTSGSHAEEAAAIAEVKCPTCNVVIPTGDKPVVSMLAGKTHTCPSCSKEYTVAADQSAHSCTACGGEVMACPACGGTELVKS